MEKPALCLNKQWFWFSLSQSRKQNGNAANSLEIPDLPKNMNFSLRALLFFLLHLCFLSDYCFAQSSKSSFIDPQQLLNAGKIQLQNRQYALSLRSLSAALRKSPNLAEAYYVRGKTYDALGNHESAISDFTKYIDLKTKDPAGYIARGDARNFSGQHESAVKDYETALTYSPGSISARLGRGLALVGLHAYDEAIKDYQWVLQSDPHHLEALENMGIACMLAGRRMEAMSYFEKALKLETDPVWRVKMERWMEKLLHEASAVGKNDIPRQRSVGPRALW